MQPHTIITHFLIPVNNIGYDLTDVYEGAQHMAHGQIAEDKTRISLVIPRDLKAALETAAAAQQRSMSNYIVTILTAAMQQQDQEQRQQ